MLAPQSQHEAQRYSVATLLCGIFQEVRVVIQLVLHRLHMVLRQRTSPPWMGRWE